jgi:membrane-bound metal-dependent hydrolase YbcI (DUF457 family)
MSSRAAIGRSLVAVVIAFLLMEAANIAVSIVVTRLAINTTTFLFINVGYVVILAAAGGYLAAALARHRGVLHGSLLAVLIVLVGLLSGTEGGRNQPRWYPAVMTFGSAAAAVFGGYLCSRFRRQHSSGHYRPRA